MISPVTIKKAKAQISYIQKIKSERSFYEFVKYAWSVIDPSTFVDGWHIKAICDHLQAVHEGKIKRLIINIPPRAGKSLLVSVLYPAWVWIHKPAHRFLTGSHGKELAIRDTRRSRVLLQSDWYIKFWGEKFKISSDQNQKSRYDNTIGGVRLAFSIGGLLTGEGGDTIIIDDPLDADESYNKNSIMGVNEWYSSTLTTRLNDQVESAIILIMQRLNINDLSGYLLNSSKEWLHLRLPMEFESDRKCSTPIFEDPRTKENEILWGNITPEGLKKLKDGLGPINTPGQLQQRPIKKGGNIFKQDDFQTYRGQIGKMDYIIQSWDFAAKEKQENDYYAMVTIGLIGNKFYLLDLWRDKVEYPDAKAQVYEYGDKWKPNIILIEDKANGSAALQEVRRDIKYAIKGIIPQGDKIMRANAVSPLVSDHRYYLPEPRDCAFINEYIDELISFPASTNDDWVDATTQALNYMRDIEPSEKAQEVDPKVFHTAHWY